MSNQSTDPTAGLGKSLLVVGVITLVGVGLSLATGSGGAQLAGVPVMWLCIGLAFALNWAAFVPSFVTRTEHYYDLTGALTYSSVIALALIACRETLSVRSVVVAAMVLVWAIRLGTFLFGRVKRQGKDGRFDEMKHSFGRFLVAWTLQGLWVSFTAAAALAAITAPVPAGIDAFFVVGSLIWAIGFAIEVVADRQKSAWRLRRDAGQTEHDFITSGLWAYSRHPNYFGEIVLWVGVALIALPTLAGWRYVALVSPVFVALLLTKISGVPLLEASSDKRFGDDTAYKAYKARTNVLILGPRR